MKTNPLISIITPVYNSAEYISEAIESVFQQTYKNWELIIINDGSIDESRKIIKTYQDPRISYFEQENKGVSAARNAALKEMQGEFFCLLDADDTLPENSLEDRLKVFLEDEQIQFVDGSVNSFIDNPNRLKHHYSPNFTGNPFDKLLVLSEECFFGPSWMIRVKPGKIYKFDERLTHAEDLLFYLSIADSGLYSYTDNPVYNYRLRRGSAMSNLKGLSEGYFNLYKILSEWESVTEKQKHVLHKKIKSILFKSYLSQGRLIRAMKTLYN